MSETEFFPLGLAAGDFFCNRYEERERLKKNITKGHHTILVSPRRYGKTSLTFQVFSEFKRGWLWEHADFLMASDPNYIQNKILSCVGHVIPKLLPTHKKAIEKIKKFFSFANAKFVISANGPSVEFSQTQKPQETIAETLIGLDKMAKEEKKRVVLLFDEFQQIGTIKHCGSIEAAIRHAAERAKHVNYIFSGSNRHLLTQMFDDSARPLYHLCVKLVLNRIAEEEYEKHFQVLAKKRWRKLLKDEIIEAIFDCAKCHPYYTNLLCSQIWEHKQPPQHRDAVIAIWQRYVDDEQGRIAHEIARLSTNQRAVIRTIANNDVNQPASKIFVENTRLPLTSTVQAINAMLKKDIIYKDKRGYIRVLDPSMEYFIRYFFS